MTLSQFFPHFPFKRPLGRLFVKICLHKLIFCNHISVYFHYERNCANIRCITVLSFRKVNENVTVNLHVGIQTSILLKIMLINNNRILVLLHSDGNFNVFQVVFFNVLLGNLQRIHNSV